MKQCYLLLCVLGVALPYWAFLPWLLEHGLALHLLAQHITASPVAAFAWADVLVSAAALLALMWQERSSCPWRRCWPVLPALLCVGVSLALPLYLYLRTRHARR